MIAVYQMLIGINKLFHNHKDDNVVAAARERQLEHDSDRMRSGRIKVSASIGVQREFQNHAVTLSLQEQEALDKYLIRIPLYRGAYITAGVICLGFI
ncbi:hypothetical protein [Candidatus Coxiella mudrowiae]|uniref:hypothetical protein n=1 Tax=Candidatus Coxiella mudrowiae TaxID=2054173 RepID=UPI0012FF36CA|nr:hypothetical protein [Candidatus Coxiella mudrowiae]